MNLFQKHTKTQNHKHLTVYSGSCK